MSKPIFAVFHENCRTKRVCINENSSVVMMFDDQSLRVEPEGGNTCGYEIDWPLDSLYDRYAVLTCSDPTSISLTLYKQDAQSRHVISSSTFKMCLEKY